MAIRVPGLRTRHGRAGGGKRNSIVMLNMTAMVDMFTVLCVFLLQNYATTNQVLPMPDKVDLPSAAEVKELKPSNVIVIASDGISLNNIKVADFGAVKQQEDWMIQTLNDELEKVIREGEDKKRSLGNQLRQAVQDAKNQPQNEAVEDFKKITIQSDKGVDFLTVKKIMYTVTAAGMEEINFAVIKKPQDAAAM